MKVGRSQGGCNYKLWTSVQCMSIQKYEVRACQPTMGSNSTQTYIHRKYSFQTRDIQKTSTSYIHRAKDRNKMLKIVVSSWINGRSLNNNRTWKLGGSPYISHVETTLSWPTINRPDVVNFQAKTGILRAWNILEWRCSWGSKREWERKLPKEVSKWKMKNWWLEAGVTYFGQISDLRKHRQTSICSESSHDISMTRNLGLFNFGTSIVVYKAFLVQPLVLGARPIEALKQASGQVPSVAR